MYSLLHHNTFGIHAYCRDFKSYASLEDLLALLPELHRQPWFHIGRGSNILFVRDYDGLILHSDISDFEWTEEDEGHVLVKAGAGYEWDAFVERCIGAGFYGLENLSYIPGEVGASAVQNIGAYGVEVSQFIRQVEAVEVATGKVRIFSNAECRYGYRYSIFKGELKNQYIITHVTYVLDKTFTPKLGYGAIQKELEKRQITPGQLTAAGIRQVVTEIRKSKLPDPQEVGSAGSFFVNPVVSQEKYEELLKDYPQMPSYQVASGVKIPAGWLIEQCGWKGRKIGAAGVYDKQALVLVNWGGASGQDIVDLSGMISRDVQAKFGIQIYPEVLFV